jgi:hypothetical protein
MKSLTFDPSSIFKLRKQLLMDNLLCIILYVKQAFKDIPTLSWGFNKENMREDLILN